MNDPNTTCPADDVLLRFLTGTTDAGQELEQHLDTCSRCAERLNALLVPPDLAPLLGSPQVAITVAQTPGDVLSLVASHDADTMPNIPGYTVLRKLGEGGMGAVYLARQDGLKREVAVKTLNGPTVSRAQLARFWAEAEVMAEVRHPNVVQVIELGEAGGRPFMAMEYVPGGSLAQRLAGGARLAPLDAARLVESVARGVAAAHDRGVVHRDLKPDNVLLDGDTPKVADFGIAKRRAHELTKTEAFMGTPAYMAPEQAESRAKFAGPPADVWALGVILYECLSGRRPFAGDSVAELAAKITREEPPALRTVSRGVPRDLQAVVSKCLTKEPEHRYPTAGELADDLARFVRGEPVPVRLPGAVERAARWARRKPTQAGLVAALLLVVLLTSVGGTITAIRIGQLREAEAQAAVRQLQAEQKQADSERERQREQDAARLARSRLLQSEAEQAWAAGDFAETRAKAAAALLEKDDPTTRRLFATANNAAAHQLWAADPSEQPLAWSRDGLWVVASGPLGLRVANASTGESVKKIPGVATEVVAVHPNGQQVAWVQDDAPTVFEIASGKPRKLRAPDGVIRRLTFSQDGRELLAVCTRVRRQDGDRQEVIGVAVASWDLAGGEQPGLRPVARTQNEVSVTAVDHAGLLLAVAVGADIVLLNLGSWETRTISSGHSKTIRCLAFSPDGRHIVSADGSREFRLWAVATGQGRLFRTGDDRRDGDCAVAINNQYVIGPSREEGDGSLTVWAIANGTPVAQLPGIGSLCVGLSAAPDGLTLFASYVNGRSRTWELKAFAVEREQFPEPDQLVVSPDGRTLVACHREGFSVLDAHSGKHRVYHDLPKGHGPIGAVAFASPDRLVALIGRELWHLDPATGQPLRKPVRLDLPDDPLCSRFSPDGELIAVDAGGLRGVVSLYETGTGKLLQCLKVDSKETELLFSSSFAFHTDQLGNLVVFAVFSQPGNPDVTRLAGWRYRAKDEWRQEVIFDRVVDLEDQPVSLAFNPADWGQVVLTGQQLVISVTNSPGFGTKVVTPVLLPPGKWLAASLPRSRSVIFGGADGTVRLATCRGALVDNRDGKTPPIDYVRIIGRHPTAVRSVSASPDGRTIYSVDVRGEIRAWAVSPNTREWSGDRFAFAPDGHSAVIEERAKADGPTDLVVREAKSGRELRRLKLGAEPLAAVALLSDGTVLAVTPGNVRTWPGSRPQEVGNVALAESDLMDPFETVLSRDGRYLAAPERHEGDQRKLRVWETTTGQVLETHDLSPFGGSIGAGSLAFTDDGSTLLVAMGGKHSVVHSHRLGSKVWTPLQETFDWTPRLAVRHHGNVLVTAGGDKNTQVVLVDATSLKSIASFDVKSECWATAVHPARPWVALAADSRVEIWDWERKESVTELFVEGMSKDTVRIDFSPDGAQLWINCNPGDRWKKNLGRVRAWDLSRLQHLISAPADQLRVELEAVVRSHGASR